MESIFLLLLFVQLVSCAPDDETQLKIAIIVLVSIVIVLLIIGGIVFLVICIRRRNALSSDSENSFPRVTSSGSNMSRSSSTNSASSLYRYDPPEDLGYNYFEEVTRSKWSKPINKHPIHIDLPRLAKGVEVYKNGKLMWPTIDVNLNDKRELVVLSLLRIFFYLLESTEAMETMTLLYLSYFKDNERNHDFSRKLQRFFTECIGDDSRVGRIFKGTTQASIAPAVVRMKYLVANQFPFCDIVSGWKVSIEITDYDVSIKHTKWEKSYEPNSFAFKWEYQIIFDIQMNDISSTSLRIPELIFGGADGDARQEEIRKALNLVSICHPNQGQLHNTWEMTTAV